MNHPVLVQARERLAMRNRTKRKVRFGLTTAWLISTLGCLLISFFYCQAWLSTFLLLPFTVLWLILWLRYSSDSHTDSMFMICACGLIFILCQLAVSCWFWYNAVVADPNSQWSAGGKSSCYSDVSVQEIYNPKGYLTTGMFFNDNFAICHTLGLRWADVNGEVIQGYPALAGSIIPTPNITAPVCTTLSCAHLATNRPIDYPDPGTGLTNGLYPATTTLDWSYCPGIDTAKYNANKILGSGKVICSSCTQYFKAVYEITDVVDHCTANQIENTFCELCASLTVSQTLTMRYLTAAIWVYYSWSCWVLMIYKCISHA